MDWARDTVSERQFDRFAARGVGPVAVNVIYDKAHTCATNLA